MKCPNCNADIRDNAKFCDSCGAKIEQKIEAEGLIQQDNKEYFKNNDSDKNKKSSIDSTQKKKIFKIIVAIFAIVIAVAIFKLAISPMLTYNSALKDCENGEYATAIEKFVKIPDYKNVNELVDETYFDYGKQLIDKEKYQDALDAFQYTTNAEVEKYRSYGVALRDLEQKKYKDSINRLRKLGDFEKSKEFLNKAYYDAAEELYEKKQFSDAKGYYEQTTGYNNIKEKIQACDFMQAENYAATGKLDEALKIYKSFPKNTVINNTKVSDRIDNCVFLQGEKEYENGNYMDALKKYKKLPKDFEINGIKAKQRIDKINKNKDVLKLSGLWLGKDGKNTVRQTHKSTGLWDEWNGEYTHNMNVVITLNDDDTFNIKGEANYYTYTNYSSISTGLRGMFIPVSFEKKNIKKIPSTLYKEGSTSLTYDGSKFYVNYDYTNENYSMNFTYHYKSSISYKKK